MEWQSYQSVMTAPKQTNRGDLCRVNIIVNSPFILKASMSSCQTHNQPTAENLFLHYIFKTPYTMFLRALQVPRSRTVTLRNLKVWKPDPFNLNSFIIGYDLVATSFHLNTLWKSWRLFQPYYIIAKKPFQWPAGLESVSTIFHNKVSDYMSSLFRNLHTTVAKRRQNIVTNVLILLLWGN